ncbi:hypothetical protein VNI00_001537 [Paramarasmius palmivorus]|uniref:Syntaxin n=1 Tax=Paramarasmius palmivorus TaxID=297713 RepID=A0AAW0E132_9AGAR
MKVSHPRQNGSTWAFGRTPTFFRLLVELFVSLKLLDYVKETKYSVSGIPKAFRQLLNMDPLRVTDVGHGTGESLMFLLSASSTPKLGSLTGITSLLFHYERSRARVDSLKSTGTGTETELHLGDAVYRPGVTSKHPLCPTNPSKYDVILALDCAYHFQTRRQFLSQAFEGLEGGGRIGLADICFDDEALKTTSLIRRFLRMMPKENVVGMKEYVKSMEDIGYTNVELEDISANVFPGFTSFLRKRGIKWKLFAYILNLYAQKAGARDYQERSDPKPHTAYRIQVQANVRSWSMWRRYSEFDDLHTELTKATGSPPPLPLPPKHRLSVFRSHSDPKLLEERKAGLEAYLRAILSSKDDKWRETFEFKDFLGVPVGRQAGVVGGPPTQFTSASWLDEHQELQNRLRDVRADINKREALSDQGDVNASHKSNVSAKQKLAGVLSRIGNLGRGLQELAMGGMSEGELQRRTDMVARLQDDCEKLGKMVTVARQQSARLGGEVGTFATNTASASDREALMGPNTFTRVTRVFGKPQETEETRPLDNHGLFSLQQTQMQQQDDQLSQLTTILRRQRHLGEAISTEIASQIDMLDDVNNEVDRVGGKLQTTQRQLNRLG